MIVITTCIIYEHYTINEFFDVKMMRFSPGSQKEVHIHDWPTWSNRVDLIRITQNLNVAHFVVYQPLTLSLLTCLIATGNSDCAQTLKLFSLSIRSISLAKSESLFLGFLKEDWFYFFFKNNFIWNSYTLILYAIRMGPVHYSTWSGTLTIWRGLVTIRPSPVNIHYFCCGCSGGRRQTKI